MIARPSIYGLMAEFDNPHDLLIAVQQARAEGYRRVDAYTPLPAEGLAEAFAYRRTWVPFIVLIGGVVGAIGGYFLQYYLMAVNYPINVGGRPLNSWPAFIPVTFELAVLAAALAAVFGLLVLSGLPQPFH